MEEIFNEINNNKEFIEIIQPLIDNETVQEMKKYRQHYETTTYDHCLEVSYYCYKICKKFKLDYVSAAKAAMVHDLFLYDWRVKNDREGLHAFTHPQTACENAEKLFKLNEKEKDIIKKHMWPVTVVPPKYKEGYILTLVDKYCALEETAKYMSKKKALKYAYVLLGGILFKKLF